MKQSTLHIALIMDGNGRWAQAQGLPRFAGHCAGAEALRAIVEAAPAFGIRTLTAFAFSADNWRRPPEEVELLFSLLARYLQSETPRLVAQGVQFSAIGRRDRLPVELVFAIDRAEEETTAGNALKLRLAIDYSARESICRAAVETISAFDPDRFEDLMGAKDPVDLLIRTGGEQRLSDFLLWECAYAELYFTSCWWPDFRPADLEAALREFAKRSRRFGALPAQAAPATAIVGRGSERWLH